MVFLQKKWEKKALKDKRFRTVCNMHRLERTQKLNIRQDRYNKQKYLRKRKKLMDKLNIGERVLAERIKKKSAPGKFYEQSVQNISSFNKDTIFTVRKKQTIDEITYYWVNNTSNNKNLTKRFSRSALFALRSNFFYSVAMQ